MGEMKSVSITEKQFDEVLIKAMDNWTKKCSEGDELDNSAYFVMQLQNVAFGSLIKSVLFNTDGEDK